MQVTSQPPVSSLSEGTVGFFVFVFFLMVTFSPRDFQKLVGLFVLFYCCAWHFPPLKPPNLSILQIPSKQLKGLWVFSWWTEGDRKKLETLVTVRVSERPACHGQYFSFVTWDSLLLGDESPVFYCLCPFTLSWDELVKNKANLENEVPGRTKDNSYLECPF